jgi:hypothetical protein
MPDVMRCYLASAIRAARRDSDQGSVFGSATGLFRETIGRAIYDIDLEGPGSL